MPLESLTCTSCGSTKVKEVKPETYFCDHCETVFKHVDQHKLLVEHAAIFCSCGKPVEFQCTICNLSMCRGCDAYGCTGSMYSGRGVGIHTVGFGYVMTSQSNWYSVIAGHLYLPLRKPDPRPIIPAAKLVRFLPLSNGARNHYCWKCVAAVVPTAVAAITGDDMCIQYDCGNVPTAQCDSCLAYCCRDHIYDNPSAFIKVWNAPADKGALIEGPLGELCGDCNTSRWSLKEEVIKQVANLEKFKYDYYFHASHDKKWNTGLPPTRKQLKLFDDAKVLSAQYAHEINQKLMAISSEEVLKRRDASDSTVSIFDDRASTAPSAAPSVNGAL